MVGRNFTVFSLFHFVFEDTVFKHKPPGAYIRRGHLTKRFLRYGFEGLIFRILRHGEDQNRCMAIYN